MQLSDHQAFVRLTTNYKVSGVIDELCFLIAMGVPSELSNVRDRENALTRLDEAKFWIQRSE